MSYDGEREIVTPHDQTRVEDLATDISGVGIGMSSEHYEVAEEFDPDPGVVPIGGYDLDDLVKHEIGEIPGELRLVNADEDRAIYQGRATEVDVTADEDGFIIGCTVDQRLGYNHNAPLVEADEVPPFAEVLQGEINEDRGNRYEWRVGPGETEVLDQTFDDLAYTDQVLSENSRFLSRYEVGPEEK
ncbi:MAG: hypothetical protein H8Z69_04260 [Nanohaloarchaea archaeon]|nr:hypothetical protein [Candidatus Nanohaloarchaea archaeon]